MRIINPSWLIELAETQQDIVHIDVTQPLFNLMHQGISIADIITALEMSKAFIFNESTRFLSTSGRVFSFNPSVVKTWCISEKHRGQYHFDVIDTNRFDGGGTSNIFLVKDTFRIVQGQFIFSSTKPNKKWPYGRVAKLFNTDKWRRAESIAEKQQVLKYMGIKAGGNRALTALHAHPLSYSSLHLIQIMRKIPGHNLMDWFNSFQFHHWSDSFRSMLFSLIIESVYNQLCRKILIHKDIKAENVVFTGDMMSKPPIVIIDGDGILFSNNCLLGTYTEYPPEFFDRFNRKGKWMGTMPYSEKSDAFAVGRILAMLIGVDWTSYAASSIAKAKEIKLKSRQKDLGYLVQDKKVREALVRCVKKLMRNDSDKRATVFDILQLLSQTLKFEPIVLLTLNQWNSSIGQKLVELMHNHEDTDIFHAHKDYDIHGQTVCVDKTVIRIAQNLVVVIPDIIVRNQDYWIQVLQLNDSGEKITTRHCVSLRWQPKLNIGQQEKLGIFTKPPYNRVHKVISLGEKLGYLQVKTYIKGHILADILSHWQRNILPWHYQKINLITALLKMFELEVILTARRLNPDNIAQYIKYIPGDNNQLGIATIIDERAFQDIKVGDLRFFGKKRRRPDDEAQVMHENLEILTQLIESIGYPAETRGYSSAGRALAWHARGRRFDPA
jgi:serine/threonine protein kinase